MITTTALASVLLAVCIAGGSSQLWDTIYDKFETFFGNGGEVYPESIKTGHSPLSSYYAPRHEISELRNLGRDKYGATDGGSFDDFLQIIETGPKRHDEGLADGFAECSRQCDGNVKTCYFRLHIEHYPVLGGACRNCANKSTPIASDCYRPQCITANGYERSLIAVNRQMPGPAIQVCRGDRIIVDVKNGMADQTTSIHWHGISQRGSQYYDGVPYLTQCPILPGTSFRYNFFVEESGTYFYHSHTATQKMDGLAGPLIVKDVEDSQAFLYDEDLMEHVIFLSDWSNRPAEQYLPGYNNPDIVQVPDVFLFNGRAPFWGNNHSFELPLPEFVVQKGVRYRFRLIGGIGMICPLTLQFQGHRVTAISSDGNLKFVPTVVDTIVISSADRFDVILEANNTEGTYFILADSIQPLCRGIRGVAILRYNGSHNPVKFPAPPPGPSGVVLNPLNVTCDRINTNEICVSHLQGEFNAPPIENKSYSFLFLGFDFFIFDDDDLFATETYQLYDEPLQGRRVKGLINNVSFTFPPSPMISQLHEIPRDSFCAPECYSPAIKKPCSCTSVYEIPYNTIVNVIVYDIEGKSSVFSHPYHLHGYNFFILGMGVFPSNDPQERKQILTQLMHDLNNDKIDLTNKPQRDTITVPPQGYVLTRFVSNNPGYWLLHCHFVFHLEAGMNAVFMVGNQSLLPPIPLNFPRCGNFLPPV